MQLKLLFLSIWMRKIQTIELSLSFDVIPLNNLFSFVTAGSCYVSLFGIIKKINCFTRFAFCFETLAGYTFLVFSMYNFKSNCWIIFLEILAHIFSPWIICVFPSAFIYKRFNFCYFFFGLFFRSFYELKELLLHIGRIYFHFNWWKLLQLFCFYPFRRIYM